MARRQPLNYEQRRLLKIAARMPLASVANLAPVLGLDEERVRRMLGRLRNGGWVASVMRGMTERRQHRFFLTSQTVDLLYTTDHQHPSPREEARAAGLAAFHPQGELPQDIQERFALDHDLLKSGRVRWPVGDNTATREVRMTDFRLLRHGGFYHAVARYGQDLWTPFTYAGIHATERVLRRKEQHRFWGVDCYSHEEDRYLRIGNRTFYEDPDQEVEPSAQVVVAVDAWARELARDTLSGSTPTIFCTPAVELRPSRDLVSDPSGHASVGRPESAGLWLRQNPDMEAIDGRLAHRLFMTICQFPAMRASWLTEVVGGPSGEVSRLLDRFRQTGLVAVFDGRHYLSELGMKRAANMSRVLPSVIRLRHGAYLDRWYREHEQHHNDGVNRLVVRFAREGVVAVAGWRGEVNVPGLTQVRPDLLVQVSGGALGSGAHCIEFERSAVTLWEVEHKLGPYRRMAGAGRPLPLLMVCETARGRSNFRAAAGTLPMLTATLERALAGPVTGSVTVWSRDGVPTALHCES